MDIEEVRKRKEELELKFKLLLNEFEGCCGVDVIDIDQRRVQFMGVRPSRIESVKISVEI